MKIKQKMSESVRQKIKLLIKNKQDISSTIENYDLSDEYLCGAIIKNMTRIGEKITNTNFSRCIFGDKNIIINFSSCDMKGCNFSYARFEGPVWFRYADLRDTNFNDCFAIYAEAQYSNLINSTVCSAYLHFGSKAFAHAKFEWRQFRLLKKYLQLDMVDNENDDSKEKQK